MTSKDNKVLYEGMYIISSTLSDDARSKALEKITTAIESRGGEIKKLFDQGRKRLAYQIEGKKDGNFYLVFFEVGPQYIEELWKEYHLNEDLLRFVTLRTDSVPESIEFKQIVEA